jgi:TRAP-type C4-dicarboxylate transport system permease small subunit
VNKKVGSQTDTAAVGAAPVGGFSKFIYYLSKVVDPITRFGSWISATALAFMMFMTVTDVLGRKFGGFSFVHTLAGFIGPVPGSLEITELVLGIVIAFGLGYTASKKGHIRVDLLLTYATKKQTAWFDVFTYFLSFVMYCGIAWQAWKIGMSIYASQLKTAVLSISIFPFPFVLVLGAAIVALVFLRDFLISIKEVAN